MLGTALGLGVERLTSANAAPIVAGSRHHVGVPHRQTGDPVDGDGARVVSQQVGGCATDPAQRGVQAGDQRRQLLIPRRHHHPKPRPRQPGAEQLGAPTPNPGAFAPVELQPHPRLGNPGPVLSPVPVPIRRLRLGDSAASGAVSARKAHRRELLVHHVSADAALGGIHQFLDLAQERVDHPRSPFPLTDITPGIAHRHVAGHRLLVTPDQPRRRMRAPGQVVGLQDLHHFPGTLHPGVPSG